MDTGTASSAPDDDGTDSTLRENTLENPSKGSAEYSGSSLAQQNAVRTVGPFKFRPKHDDLPQKWWFASTAIPLIAATIGPLCNVLSIAALVTPWRVTLANNGQLPEGTDDSGVGITDPRWEIICNAVSLACGFTGNFFLLLNFTGRVRYIVALPLSCIFWILASFLLISITSAMHVYTPPVGPGEVYSQGFWHAVFASILYFIGATILFLNLTGYLLGHFPQQFLLDHTQRTLILQTMGFFFWLAGGAGIFCAIEGFTFTNALYYADVSVLTIGFGDLYPATDAGRGFLFVFELLGIIQLGLVISSVSRFVSSISSDKIIKAHQKHARESTVGRTVTSEKELRERLGLPPARRGSKDTHQEQQQKRDAATSPGPVIEGSGAQRRRSSLSRYGRLEIVGRTVTFHEARPNLSAGGRGAARTSTFPKARKKALSGDEKMCPDGSKKARRHQKRQKLLLLQEEKDRFEAMREIQDETRRFKQNTSVALSVLAFVLLWCLGALVFMLTEQRILGLSYFQSLYGDYSPKSNIGRPFFIVWSIFAVPTMTVLIQEMSATVIAAINDWTITVADFTVMPKKGVFQVMIDKNPRLKQWVARVIQCKAADKRVREGFQIQDPDDTILAPVRPAVSGSGRTEDQEDIAPDATPMAAGTSGGGEEDADDHLVRQLAHSIRNVAHDLHNEPPKRYSFEEWVRFTKLIRFSRCDRELDLKTVKEKIAEEEDEEGLVEWDWLGEDSPMLADVTEAQWVLDRLCESLNRFTRRQALISGGMMRSRWECGTTV